MRLTPLIAGLISAVVAAGCAMPMRSKGFEPAAEEPSPAAAPAAAKAAPAPAPSAADVLEGNARGEDVLLTGDATDRSCQGTVVSSRPNSLQTGRVARSRSGSPSTGIVAGESRPVSGTVQGTPAGAEAAPRTPERLRALDASLRGSTAGGGPEPDSRTVEVGTEPVEAPTRPGAPSRPAAAAGKTRTTLGLDVARQLIDANGLSTVQHLFFSLEGRVAYTTEDKIDLVGFADLSHLVSYLRVADREAADTWPAFAFRLGGVGWAPTKWFDLELPDKAGLVQLGATLEFTYGYAQYKNVPLFRAPAGTDGTYTFFDLRLGALARFVKGTGLLSYMEPYLGLTWDILYSGSLSKPSRKFDKMGLLLVLGAKLFVGDHLFADFQADLWFNEFTISSGLGWDF